MTKIIVDSTCDLPDELLCEHDIAILPLRVCLGENEYLDKVTINVDEVYAAMKSGIVPKTSQPNPVDIYNMFLQYCTKGCDFIYLSFSSKLSGTFQLAATILDELKEQYNNISMGIIDSKGGSTATGLIALQAAKLAEKGIGFETIDRELKYLRNHIEHIFTITDLNWLVKGGRISKSEGFVGNILNIKPILHFNDGIMEVISKVRGKKKALNTIADMVEERIGESKDQIIGISHADDLQTALELSEILKCRLDLKDIIINKIGSVLGTHLGIGGVGVFFFNKNTDFYIKEEL